MPSSGPSVQCLVCSSHSVSTWLTMLYFISLYIQNLEPGVSYFGIVLFLRWIRGGTQGCPYQHPVSNEGAGISAVQWEALQFCGFTWETQAIRKMQWSHSWPSRTRGSILPNSYWIKELDIAIPSCAQPTPSLSFWSFFRKPRTPLTFLSRSLYSKQAHLAYCTTSGPPAPVWSRGCRPIHHSHAFPKWEQGCAVPLVSSCTQLVICMRSRQCIKEVLFLELPHVQVWLQV